VEELLEDRIRFGCLLPIPRLQISKLLGVAKLNETAGFDSLWVPDHLLFIPPGIVPEAWSVLAATAVVAEKATLGTCVSDPHRHHPAVLAQKVATVDQLSSGRAVLGLGAGESMNLDPFGIKWERPVSRLVEAVAIMRQLWAGKIIDREGPFWNLQSAFLHIKPSRGEIPIYFGANSPRTLRLTGELADGWLSTPLPPRLFSRHRQLVEEGASGAGKSSDEVDAGVFLYTAIARRAEDAHVRVEAIKSQIAPSPGVLREAEYDVSLPEGLKNLSYFKALPTAEWIAKFMEYSKFIPREAAIDFSIAGTTQDCINKIEEYIKAGVTHFVLINAGPNPKEVVEIYSKEIIPRFSPTE
jgi:alkanesulfonate monooxygenase SsuD/methylene tetrahydromethanopterin reductase-like flavin-dependent oxidoreductase (luciferase family)